MLSLVIGCLVFDFRGIIQLVEFTVWDRNVAGARPAASTLLLTFQLYRTILHAWLQLIVKNAVNEFLGQERITVLLAVLQE